MIIRFCRDPGKRRDNLSYTIGDMGLVPRRDAVLLTNYDVFCENATTSLSCS